MGKLPARAEHQRELREQLFRRSIPHRSHHRRDHQRLVLQPLAQPRRDCLGRSLHRVQPGIEPHREPGQPDRCAEAALVVQQSLTALNTTNLFLLALQDADLVRVRNDAIRRAQEKLAIANAKLLTRATTIADSLQAMVDLTRFQLQLLTDQRNLADAEANLARQVGMDGRIAAVSDSSLSSILRSSPAQRR